MDFYIEITLLPDAEFSYILLLNSLYNKLHKTLYDISSTFIGVSFPQYKATLGNVLRLHGNSKDLERLMAMQWIGALNGYCEIEPISKVPSDCKYRKFSRQQSNMSQAKLRRLIKRGTLKPDMTVEYVSKMGEKLIQSPYLELTSISTGQRYRRYIKISEITNIPTSGNFDCFGLSKSATVPWF